MEPIFFSSPEEWRAWLHDNHESATEVWVGQYRKKTGKPSLTWSEAVDQALCYGWIDGVRKSIDDESFMQRFTPRRPTSNWSAVNVAKVAELQKQGLMQPAGLAAFERRREDKTAVYSYENRAAARFDRAQTKRFKAEAGAWEFFTSQPPGYRTTATFWVVSAKREETRERRLTKLIEDSAAGRRLAQLSATPKKS